MLQSGAGGRLVAALEQLNTRFRRNTVTIGGPRQDVDGQLRCVYRTNRWSTHWEELPAARLTQGNPGIGNDRAGPTPLKSAAKRPRLAV
ncbi:DUF4113 domain-containing protein [Kushneria sp. Sum13]|uniref:DUF4113 domain-containing protein n=1 Tax=Kushneria sp. Sum13 TaxID=3459196 RepID=UPI0040464E3E